VLAEVKRRVAGASPQPPVVAEAERLQFERNSHEFSYRQRYLSLSIAQSLTLSAIVARPVLRIIPYESVVLILPIPTVETLFLTP
jgi:hypothetical protein